MALIQQRDAIQTAKLVASIDQVSQGRFLLGVGEDLDRVKRLADMGVARVMPIFPPDQAEGSADRRPVDENHAAG